MDFRTRADASWIDDFVRAADRSTPAARSALYRAADEGKLVKLARGVYLPASRWSAMGADERYLQIVRAVALSYGDDVVFSHDSAAALWAMPMVGQWPAKAHAAHPRTGGGRSDKMLVRHCEGLPDDIERIGGMLATPLARTLVDISRTKDPATAMPMLDYALRPWKREETGVAAARVTRDDLHETLASIHTRSGAARARALIDFADGASGSPGESLSRVNIWRLGLTAPSLQTEIRDRDGRIGFVDFFWESFGVIGEFDGHGKYLRDIYLKGRTTAEVVVEEKRREDRLRALGFTVVRWEWDEARSLPRLRAKLLATGVR